MGQSDEKTRAEDAARVGVAGADNSDTAIVGAPVAPGARGVRITRRDEGDVERASTRSVYRDSGGSRRIVGSGAAIPPNWTFVEEAPLVGRGDRTETAHAADAIPNDPGRKARTGGANKSTTGPRGQGDGKPSKDQLLERAGELKIEGRSNMSKAQLEKAISKAEADAESKGGDGAAGGDGSGQGGTAANNN